jgi:hypothetical protein
MANIFELENFENFSEKINLDDLYEKKRNQDLNKLVLFNKILNRIHVRIRATSNQRTNNTSCWYVIPEVIIGVPKYDQAGCIAYIIDKLQENKFNVRYIHPNLIFISWQHWVPSYVRSELKKKMGIVVNEFGERLNDSEGTNEKKSPADINAIMLGGGGQRTNSSSTKEIKLEKNSRFTPIAAYKPSGNLIYDQDLLNFGHK